MTGRSESESSTRRRGWRPYAGTFIVASILLWTAIGLIEAVPPYVQARVTGEEEANLLLALVRVLPRWYLWALLTPAIVWLARRFPVHHRFWKPFLTVHLPASIGFTLVHVAAWLLIRSYLYNPMELSLRRLAEIYLLGYFALDLVAFWAILGGYFTFSYVGMLHDRELRATRLELHASRLETMLTQARLSALAAQLQPHFLFNTLNAIAEYVHAEPNIAEEMIVGLGDMLRLVVERAGQHEVRVQEEMEIVDVYLEIESARMGDRLRASSEVDQGVLDALVPCLSIQPLVENAVRHGVAELKGEARVRVQVSRADGRLRVEVRDNGPGPSTGFGAGTEGIGLGNTRSRLKELCGFDFRLELGSHPEGGAVTLLEIPLRWPNPDIDVPFAGG